MSNIIVMAFSPRNIVGCLLKKSLQRGGGGGVTGTLGPPSLRPCNEMVNCTKGPYIHKRKTGINFSLTFPKSNQNNFFFAIEVFDAI